MIKGYIAFICVILVLFFGCGGSKVTDYEESRITSVAWAGDSAVAFSKVVERGFIAEGIKRNPQHSVELWMGRVNSGTGILDTTYRIREIPSPLGIMEFFPGGEVLLCAAKDGVWKVNLITGERLEFFTHPAIMDYPLEIDVGPGEEYTAIVVDAEGIPQSAGLLDLFMIATEDGYLVFHTDSLKSEKSFAWTGTDCISYITPDPWEEGAERIMQFGVTDCIITPSEMTVEEVLCMCPQPDLSASGLWIAVDNNGRLAIKENGE